MLSFSFHDWLVGNIGNEGEFQYQKIYWITLIIVILFFILSCVLGSLKKLNSKQKKIILYSIAIFQLTFEIGWRLIYFFVKKSQLVDLWPMYPCNLGGIIVPIVALMNNKMGKRIFYVFGFVGACLTFALPEGIFCRDVMVFPILKSVLQHTGLLLIPAFEFTSKSYRPSVKDYPFVIIGCLIHVVNCEGIDRLFGLNEDYMFFRSGLPFVIPGVPQWITLSVFAAIVLYILCFVLNIKESITYYKNLKQRIQSRKKSTNQNA